MTLTFGSLFAGIGGMDLGLERAGMRCVWQVEIDDYARRVLAKHWPDVRRWDDVRTFPPGGAREWGCDLICGGFPCQDISNAGRRAGITGDRSSLWSEFARIIGVVRPRFVLVENVAALLGRGMGRVLGALAEHGYDAEWSVLSACAMGASHTRERLFIVAYPHQVGWRGLRQRIECRYAVPTLQTNWKTPPPDSRWEDVERWFQSFISTCDGEGNAGGGSGSSDGVSARLDRVGLCGNAVVPQVAEWIGQRILASLAGKESS